MIANCADELKLEVDTPGTGVPERSRPWLHPPASHFFSLAALAFLLPASNRGRLHRAHCDPCGGGF